MIKRTTGINAFAIATIILAVLILGRGYVARWDFSYFIVAGTDYVDPTKTLEPVWVQEGQGYDGQFFYRMALNPFDFSESKYGVTFDYPAYRAQRILYPVLIWVVTFGGLPYMVPFAMVLVNLLLFLGVIYFTGKFASRFNPPKQYKYYTFLLFGTYMSLSRDLSELSELFFFSGAVYFLFSGRLTVFGLFATLALLSRETIVIALLPLVLVELYRRKRIASSFSWPLLIPFLLFGCWKLWLFFHFGREALMQGGGNFGIPLEGVIQGFRENWNFSSWFYILQLLFWLLYFSWQCVFIFIVLKSIDKPGLTYKNPISGLVAAYLGWLVFACCLSAAIYVDDWSFIRVFTVWNLVGFLIIIMSGKKINSLFLGYSLIILILTVIRMIIRQ